MTIEELREIVKEKGFPIKLEAIDHEDVLTVTAIGNQRVLGFYNSVELSFDEYEVNQFKSHKQSKIETLYECWSDYGVRCLYFEDGRTAVFSRKCKSNLYYSEALTRKTGRTVKLDMETWEIVND